MKKLVLTTGVCAFVLTSCVYHPHAHRQARVERHAHHQARVESHPHKPGPPPHAPAHGYRHKRHSGPELVFDSALGVYLVGGNEHHYFHEGHYLRWHDGVWQLSASLGGGWVVVAPTRVPGRLVDKHVHKRMKKAKKAKVKHRNPAKHGY